MQTNPGRTWSRRIIAMGVLTAGVGLLAERGLTQSPPTAAAPGVAPAASAEPTLVDPKSKDYGTRPVAYIYDNVAVTRADLAEFLIARGGYEKVELLVNKMIIEEEAKRKGITVTTQEMEAAFAADLQISNPPIRKEDFINLILPKYNKTFYEWMEDVVRPRLILGKMCVERIKVTDDDLKKIYEREYGEKRAVKIIIWPKGEVKAAQAVWDGIRKSDAEFDRVARGQVNGSLAATAGEIKPIARYQIGDDKDKVVERMAFALGEGEVSQLFETNQGLMVMKLVKVVPADTKANFEKVKDQLHKEAYEVKQGLEIPKMFGELAERAKVKVLLSGPPSQWRYEKSARELAEDVIRQQQPVAAPQPQPVPPAAGQGQPLPPMK